MINNSMMLIFNDDFLIQQGFKKLKDGYWINSQYKIIAFIPYFNTDEYKFITENNTYSYRYNKSLLNLLNCIKTNKNENDLLKNDYKLFNK